MGSTFLTSVFPAQWGAQSALFGRTVEYFAGGLPDPPDGPDDPPVEGEEITAILREGILGEEASPGRYAHLMVRDADLAAAPASGDGVVIGTTEYTVVIVAATIYGISNLTIQSVS
jgi:hypothetical protein